MPASEKEFLTAWQKISIVVLVMTNVYSFVIKKTATAKLLNLLLGEAGQAKIRPGRSDDR